MISIPKIELTPAMLKLVLAIACALAVALLVYDRNRWKAAAAERRDRLVAEQTAHAGTIANYRAAAEAARQADLANVERVKAAQAAINERSANAFEKRLADARSAAGRLRGRPAAPADPGRGRAAPVPGLPAAAAGIAETAGEDGFSVADQLIATEQAIQLDELIKWVERQHSVDAGDEGDAAGPR